MPGLAASGRSGQPTHEHAGAADPHRPVAGRAVTDGRAAAVEVPAHPATGRRAPGARAQRDDPVGAVLDLFRAQGGRVTVSRRLLLRCLFDRPGHRTADELVAAVQALDPEVHRSTIYRNLDELERLGVVEHVHLGHGPATYHLSTEQHGHLVCERCGTAFAVPDAFFAPLAEAALSELGFHVRARHFAVLGTCGACAAADEEPAP